MTSKKNEKNWLKERDCDVCPWDREHIVSESLCMHCPYKGSPTYVDRQEQFTVPCEYEEK